MIDVPEPSKHVNTRVSRIARGTVNARAIRGNRAYLSATRNPYDAPTEAYTGTEKPTPPPSKGTPRREEWERKIGELRAQGKSYVDIAVEMNASEFMVRKTCLLRGFVKGE